MNAGVMEAAGGGQVTSERRPRALVLRAPGTNCDRETLRALDLAGARADAVHIEALLSGDRRLEDQALLVIPGGFTYGDDLGAGVILATRLRTKLAGALRDFVAAGGLVLGICNGFQVLVRAGLLPGPGMEGTVTLAGNDSGRFESRWVRLRSETGISPFLVEGGHLDCPVAHGEGRFVARDASVLEELQRNGQIALRYVDPEPTAGGGVRYPFNPNGSMADVAGICDPTGRILGLMPHPERNVEPWHNPAWTRLARTEAEPGAGPGLEMFRRCVQAALRGAGGSGS